MGYIDLYYCDESHFGLTPNVCYAWQHNSKPTFLPAAKGKRLSVLGLMSPCNKFFSRIFEGNINSDAAIAVIDEFCQTITKRTVIVIDNALLHRSKKFTAKIKEWEEQDLLIYYLPPYSPELNIIEILWRFIKYQWLPFDAFTSFQNLKYRIEGILDNIGSKYRINFY